MRMRKWMVIGLLLLPVAGLASAEEAKVQYPAHMAPLEQYKMASSADEIALARSAAPPSISNDAEVLVLGDRGYETAVKGKNGFVCFVWRSWDSGFGDPEFWNTRISSPACLNAAAARTVLPTTLERTQWALAGLSQAQMIERAKKSAKANMPPAPGSMCYMMSRRAYLSDAGKHWHPHLMFFLPRTEPSAWGANLPGSPMIAFANDLEPVTVFLVAVSKWSDGTPVTMDMHQDAK
jgi:hypothetical protein